MGFKIKNSFLLIILILLQSCSGGRIGNFLESSFKNIEQPKIKEDNKDDVKNKIVIRSNENIEKNLNIEEAKIKEDNKDDNKDDVKNKMLIKKEKNLKNKKKTIKNISNRRRQYQPQSYKIIFILKDVDPKDPIEDLSTILRNSDVNFEIEKIERFFDSKGKSKKNN